MHCCIYSLMYVGSLKGLKKWGTRGEGRQGKIGDEIILSRDHGNGNLAPVPFTESRRLCLPYLMFSIRSYLPLDFNCVSSLRPTYRHPFGRPFTYSLFILVFSLRTIS